MDHGTDDQAISYVSGDTPPRPADAVFAASRKSSARLNVQQVHALCTAYILRTTARCPHYRQRAHIVQALLAKL